jgi:hypothetical protein
MPHYQTLIDPTNFGAVARYLQDSRSPIHYVLHVKNESMLPELAGKLDATMAPASARQAVSVRSILDPLFEQGMLRISCACDGVHTAG